jgi:hypothetical protein
MCLLVRLAVLVLLAIRLIAACGLTAVIVHT